MVSRWCRPVARYSKTLSAHTFCSSIPPRPRTIIPSFALTIVVPAVLGTMALCVVHANLAAQNPQIHDRLIALFFGAAAPYFGVVVLPAENALLAMKNTRDAGFAGAMATITTGHFVLVGLSVASLVMLYLRGGGASHAKGA